MTCKTAVSQTNLALLNSTEVSTSFVSPHERLSAVNDNNPVLNSGDRNYAVYGNWNGEGEYGNYNWVEYAWDMSHTVTSTSVYWFSDGGGLLPPNDAYIEYWNGLEWVNAGAIGNQLNTFNTLDNLNLLASKIRIYMASDTSTGILEFQVFGTETTDCPPTTIIPMVSSNGVTESEQNYIVLSTGDDVQFNPELPENTTGGLMEWNGPNNYMSSQQIISFTNLSTIFSGTYTFTYINNCGTQSDINFHLTVQDESSTQFSTWPAWGNELVYDWKSLYPDFPEPTKTLVDDYPGYTGCNVDWTMDYGSWTFMAGPNANEQITPLAVSNLLERVDGDFRFLRDNMGWPPDKLHMNGYRSVVYLLGSGLCEDTMSNTDLGGWMGVMGTPDGEIWHNIILTYYPVISFHPDTPDGYQQGAVVHEGIHAVLANLPGVKNAAWFHEGCNVWLQTVLEIEKAGGELSAYENTDLGWLSSPSVFSPFTPIETYGGWLTDGTFAGPAAQGLVRPDGTLRNRNLFGGMQYSTIFPTFLGEIINIKSLPWVWKYAEGHVLQGIAEGDGEVPGIGDVRTRQLIQEYRARLALADFKRFTQPILNMYNNFFHVEIFAERPSEEYPEPVDSWYATPYVETTVDSEGYLIPDELTLPGWSGANFIPIHVTGDEATVTFQPLGKNMSLQLCYRTKEGDTHYSPIVNGGDCTISFDEGTPANGVIFAVICNTDYIYVDDRTRSTKFNYKLKLGEGAIQAADPDLRWFNYDSSIQDNSLSTNDLNTPASKFEIYPNPTEQSSSFNITFKEGNPVSYDLKIYNLNGQTVYSKENCQPNEQISASNLTNGLYFISVKTDNYQATKKLIVK